MMSKIKVLGSANLPLDEREEVGFTSVIPKSQSWGYISLIYFIFLQYNKILGNMKRIYSTAKVHPEPNISWSLEPGE